MSKWITEDKFVSDLRGVLSHMTADVKWVTGPGRSGAICSVYASYILGVPFVPYKHSATGLGLVIDTTSQSGKTIRKALKVYERMCGSAMSLTVYNTEERLHFWYENLTR